MQSSAAPAFMGLMVPCVTTVSLSSSFLSRVASFGPRTSSWDWLVEWIQACTAPVLWSCVLMLAGVGPFLWEAVDFFGTWRHMVPPPPSPWALLPVLLIIILLSLMYWCADLILDISRGYAESEIGKVATLQLVQAKGRHA